MARQPHNGYRKNYRPKKSSWGSDEETGDSRNKKSHVNKYVQLAPTHVSHWREFNRCRRKVRHEKLMDAQHAMELLIAQAGALYQRRYAIYTCDVCGGYHVGKEIDKPATK